MADDEPTTIDEAITEVALGPQEVTTAGMGHSKEHDLDQLIAAAKFSAPSAVKQRIGGGMKFTQATPGGSA